MEDGKEGAADILSSTLHPLSSILYLLSCVNIGHFLAGGELQLDPSYSSLLGRVSDPMVIMRRS